MLFQYVPFGSVVRYKEKKKKKMIQAVWGPTKIRKGLHSQLAVENQLTQTADGP